MADGYYLHFHQIGLAMRLYAGDYDDRLPPTWQPGWVWWAGAIRPYMERMRGESQVGYQTWEDPALTESSAIVCPSYMDPEPNYTYGCNYGDVFKGVSLPDGSSECTKLPDVPPTKFLVADAGNVIIYNWPTIVDTDYDG
ncbi:MAG: hypothetical protein GWP14_09500, partial [Actinobacteria bacterium]|nr:hypothetical protein [Actinomycetota bacterium]